MRWVICKRAEGSEGSLCQTQPQGSSCLGKGTPCHRDRFHTLELNIESLWYNENLLPSANLSTSNFYATRLYEHPKLVQLCVVIKVDHCKTFNWILGGSINSALVTLRSYIPVILYRIIHYLVKPYN